MCPWKPSTGHIPEWKTNKPHNTSRNIYDNFSSSYFRMLKMEAYQIPPNHVSTQVCAIHTSAAIPATLAAELPLWGYISTVTLHCLLLHSTDSIGLARKKTNPTVNNTVRQASAWRSVGWPTWPSPKQLFCIPISQISKWWCCLLYLEVYVPLCMFWKGVKPIYGHFHLQWLHWVVDTLSFQSSVACQMFPMGLCPCPAQEVSFLTPCQPWWFIKTKTLLIFVKTTRNKSKNAPKCNLYDRLCSINDILKLKIMIYLI